MGMATRAVAAAAADGKKTVAAQAAKSRELAERKAAEKPETRFRQDVKIKPQKLNRRRNVRINSAKLMDAAHAMLGHYGRWPDPALQDVATGWAATTWFRDRQGKLLFDAHPRLMFIAPPQSGKSHLMRGVGGICRDWTGLVDTMVTAPGLREALDHGMTITLDEFDREVGGGKANMEIQKFVAAYNRDGGSLDARGGGMNQQSAFGAMMLGAKPRIMTATGGWIDDLFTRAFIVVPKHSADRIPKMDASYAKLTETLRKGFALWGEAERPDDPDELLWPIHDTPEKLSARQLEISEPLLAVADRAVDPQLIAETGSDVRWAIRMREAVQAVLAGHGDSAPEVMAEVNAQLEAIGIEIGEDF